MRLFYCMILCFAFCLTTSAQEFSKAGQLKEFAEEWHNYSWLEKYEQEPAQDLNAHELILLHGGEVIKFLKANTPTHLSSEQLLARKNCIALLEEYRSLEQFPLDFYNLKKPYFIDPTGTHCAVGQLMKCTGSDDLAQKIASTQNYALVKDIKVNGIEEWASKNGLTVNELKLIQFPSYSAALCDEFRFSEFHYAMQGPDSNEYVEFIMTGLGAFQQGVFGMDASKVDSVFIVLYDGRTGMAYDTADCKNATFVMDRPMSANFKPTPTVSFGQKVIGAVKYPSGTILDDSCGFALIGPDLIWHFDSTTFTLIPQNIGYKTYEFFSVGNRFVAQNGPAQRILSTQMSVTENEFSSPDSSVALAYSCFDATIGLAFGGFFKKDINTAGYENTKMQLFSIINTVPIALTDFNAAPDQNSINIFWTTESEQNNFGFEIEKLIEDEWIKIDQVRSKNPNSNNTLNYHSKDLRPRVGSNYYRLKQIDLDGTIWYSEAILVEYKKDQLWSCFPNPNNGVFTISLIDGHLIGTDYNVYGVDGRIVKSGVVNSIQETVIATTLPNGIYMLELKTAERPSFSKIVIRH